MAKSDGWQIKTVWRPAAASRAPLRSPFRFCARIFFLFPSPPFSASPTLVSAAIFPLPLHRFACGFFGDGRRAPGRKRTVAHNGTHRRLPWINERNSPGLSPVVRSPQWLRMIARQFGKFSSENSEISPTKEYVFGRVRNCTPIRKRNYPKLNWYFERVWATILINRSLETSNYELYKIICVDKTTIR